MWALGPFLKGLQITWHIFSPANLISNTSLRQEPGFSHVGPKCPTLGHLCDSPRAIPNVVERLGRKSHLREVFIDWEGTYF